MDVSLRRLLYARRERAGGMTLPTANAYYNSANNEVVFPAGIGHPCCALSRGLLFLITWIGNVYEHSAVAGTGA